MPPTTHPAQTPRLDRLLRRLGSTLRRNIWLHGLGTAIAAGAAWLIFMYVADRVLKLPAPIRIIHLVVLVGGFLFLLRKTLFRHAAEVPDRDGLAMMAQRALPDDVPRDDRFVSAVQLRETVAADSASAPLVERIAQAAEEVAPRADLAKVTDSRGPIGRISIGAVAATAATALLASNPAMARIFGARMFGQPVSWPRDTTLTLDVPEGAAALDVTRPTDDVIYVRAARGSDVPILVTASGEVPELVTLRFASGASIEIGPTGKDVFRTILPSIQENTRVRAFGGDDQRGTPAIEVEVLQPPDLAGLAFAVEPPEYSKLPARTEFGTTVSVLAGSNVRVIAETDPDNAVGVARTFPDDELIDLTRVPFPARPDAEAPSGEGAAAITVTGLSFDRSVTESLRFRMELTDDTGLSNPDPALFGIEVIPDRRPELVTLSPARAEVQTVEGGAIPLRVLARDDFGLASFRYEVRDAATEDILRSVPLELEDAPGALESLGRSARSAGVATALLEVKALGANAGSPDSLEGAPLLESQAVTLQTFAMDARMPSPNETRSAPIRVRVISADEFLRQQRDGLGRAAEDVSETESRLATTMTRLSEFKSAMDGDEAEVPAPNDLTLAINEARRLQGDLRGVARDLSGLASSMIYSRMDDRAGALETRLFEVTSTSIDRSFSPEMWQTLADETAAGQLGAPERAGELVRLVGLSLDASGPQSDRLAQALEAARAVSEAGSSAALSDASSAVDVAIEAATNLRATIESLMNDLGEWDNMQAIISLTRDIANRQKNLTEKLRTGPGAGK